MTSEMPTHKLIHHKGVPLTRAMSGGDVNSISIYFCDIPDNIKSLTFVEFVNILRCRFEISDYPINNVYNVCHAYEYLPVYESYVKGVTLSNKDLKHLFESSVFNQCYDTNDEITLTKRYTSVVRLGACSHVLVTPIDEFTCRVIKDLNMQLFLTKPNRVSFSGLKGKTSQITMPIKDKEDDNND